MLSVQGSHFLLHPATPSQTPPLHRYHIKDVIVGKIFFMLVRIKVKHMELAIIKKETVGYAVIALRCRL